MSSLEKPIFPRDERGSDSPLPEVLARDFFARLSFRQGGGLSLTDGTLGTKNLGNLKISLSGSIGSMRVIGFVR